MIWVIKPSKRQLWFTSKNSYRPYVGFSVRRYHNGLYVTESPQDNRLTAGDKIVQIDGEDITKLAVRYRKNLKEELPERQEWDSIIRRSKMVCVEREERLFELSLSHYEVQPYKPCHIFKHITMKLLISK
ncbi:hypothetical protein [Bacillus sp. 1P06AnD]|uniref:hypothetical protein n=1 Tax=Bacillus sp. 1P06AnD TaxID=3132208 RepID=UPI00399FB233